MENARDDAGFKKAKLTLPIVTIGAPEFFVPLVEEQMARVSEGVECAAVFEECGYSLALEAEGRLAAMLPEHMLGR